ncbi:MAG: tRNA glutamyl-Q(34) synthetase GluQRS [Gammaproteobacteria bacterium]|nr:tRNA glutamyl-Q(34) synthetase GluQRS [Gammaproteobacteria bacterium]
MIKTNFKRKKYRGRFAPSPSGELHFGSLLAAMASYTDARHNKGDWLLRIDDIDQARVINNSDKHILSTLEHCGFEWDESITYQSQYLEHYQEALERLNQTELTYPCTCSRKQIKEMSENMDIKNGIYPGTCRNKNKHNIPKNTYAIRLKVPVEQFSFNDHIQGDYSQNLAQDVGDFVVYRRDNVFSYQLSVVVDDFQSKISHIVRGYDLLDSTPKQMYLQQLLDYPKPQYAHIPLAVTQDNLKLSKLSHAKKVTGNLETLVLAAQFLGQKVPDSKDFDNKDDFWQYLVTYWDINKVPRMEKQIIMV